ncbi:MAG: hypothetical protein ACRDY0_09465 [Acidimicrobiales bacterium]
MVNDFVQTSQCASGGNWIQVGWAQTSFLNPSGPQVFEFDSERCQWEFFGQYGIGQYSPVSYSVTGTGTTWTTWIYWNNTWNQLLSASMPWSTAPVIEQQQETYNDNSSVPTPNVPEHENEGTGININGTWTTWTGGIPTQVSNQAPYCVFFYSPYYNWAVGDNCTGAPQPG